MDKKGSVWATVDGEVIWVVYHCSNGIEFIDKMCLSEQKARHAANDCKSICPDTEFLVGQYELKKWKPKIEDSEIPW